VLAKGMLSLSALVVAAVVLASASGAAVSRTGPRIDVSTRAAATTYLRSIHVNPTGLVIQRGTHNYAGPSCPGSGWSCTSTDHPVVQVAAAGGKNEFVCAATRCAVVQAAEAPLGVNIAKCIRTTGITQSCSISQTSTANDNQAIVYENAVKTTGLTQNASQTANIVQNALGASNGNTACVYQNMLINTMTIAPRGMPVTATLDGHQTINVAQEAVGGPNAVQKARTASNYSCDSANPLTQTQTISQTATGSAMVTQNENRTAGGPNALIDIEQNQHTPTATGPNTANFTQTSELTATAYTQNGPVFQRQSLDEGGIRATVNQFSTGLSTSQADQTETLFEHAQKSPTDPSLPPNTTQTQRGPVHCCSIQQNNLNNSFGVTQITTLTNDTHADQTNLVQALCSTSGNCTADQTATLDGQPPTENFQSGQNVTAETNCTETGCTTEGGQTGSQLSVNNTDIGEFGYGGMRGDGTGSITVGGVSGTVTKALLYWNGPTNSTDPTANAAVTFAGTPVTGTNIGFASDNCWGFQNSHSYRADVTPLVTGNGSYSLSDFRKAGPPVADINGVSLIVFYDDGSTANDRNIVLWNGNDSNVASTFDPQGWDETITGVPYPGGGTATLDFVVSDGQGVVTQAQDDALVLNGSTLVPAGHIFSGDSTPHGGFDADGDLWDVKGFDMTSFLNEGSNDLHLTTGLLGDCLSLVTLIANVPAAPPPPNPGLPSGLRQQSGEQGRAARLRSVPAGPALPSRQRSGAQARTGSTRLPGDPSAGGIVRN
jgi:hypothetical protein